MIIKIKHRFLTFGSRKRNSVVPKVHCRRHFDRFLIPATLTPLTVSPRGFTIHGAPCLAIPSTIFGTSGTSCILSDFLEINWSYQIRLRVMNG